jgi:carboxypeptidase C (cathepsin A)
MIYLESPAGVGFSFSDDPADYTVGDNRTADDIYAFLQGFFTEFSWLQGAPFWVSGFQTLIEGESYGGHYVTFATARIVQGNANKEGLPINIQGFMVGNAWTDVRSPDRRLHVTMRVRCSTGGRMHSSPMIPTPALMPTATSQILALWKSGQPQACARSF